MLPEWIIEMIKNLFHKTFEKNYMYVCSSKVKIFQITFLTGIYK